MMGNSIEKLVLHLPRILDGEPICSSVSFEEQIFYFRRDATVVKIPHEDLVELNSEVGIKNLILERLDNGKNTRR